MTCPLVAWKMILLLILYTAPATLLVTLHDILKWLLLLVAVCMHSIQFIYSYVVVWRFSCAPASGLPAEPLLQHPGPRLPRQGPGWADPGGSGAIHKEWQMWVFASVCAAHPVFVTVVDWFALIYSTSLFIILNEWRLYFKLEWCKSYLSSPASLIIITYCSCCWWCCWCPHR